MAKEVVAAQRVEKSTVLALIIDNTPKCCRHDGYNALDEPEGGRWWVNTEEDKSPDDATCELPARPESVRWLLQPRQDKVDDILESHHAKFGQRRSVNVKD